MIIEMFGPPGSGKTTFAHELVHHLRQRGCATEVKLSYQPGSATDRFDRFGLVFFVGRVLAAVMTTLLILLTPWRSSREAALTSGIVGLLPPRRGIWRARLWQYILHLSHCWSQVRQSSRIAVFDQGYIQAIGSLAMFHGNADKAALAEALALVPRADLVIRIAASPDVVERQLRCRLNYETPAERLFEADMEENLAAIPIFGDIDAILANEGIDVIVVDPRDPNSKLACIERVEAAIKMQPSSGRSSSVAWASRPAASPASRLTGLIAKLSAVQGGSGNRLAHASVSALLIYVGGAGITSLAQILIARLIGSTNYGIYSYAIAWATFLGYMAALGFNISIMRFVPAYRADGKHDLVRGLIKFVSQRTMLAAVAVAAVGAVLTVIDSDLMPEMRTSMLFGMAAVPLITAYALTSALVRAFGGVISALLPERIVRDGMLMLLVGVAVAIGIQPLDARFVMAAILVSSAVTATLVLIPAFRLCPQEVRLANVSTAERREWWQTVLPLMLIAGLTVVINRSGIMVLGWVDRIRDAGVFALAINIALLVGLSRLAVSTMFSPTAASLYAQGDHAALQRLFARATLLSFAGSALLAIPLLLLAGPLLELFGKDFADSALVVRILVTGYLLAAVCGPQQNLLMMTGNEWMAASTMMLGAIVNLIGCSVGIAFAGVTGAAIGVALALVAWSAVMALYIKRRLGITPGLIGLLQRTHVTQQPAE